MRSNLTLLAVFMVVLAVTFTSFTLIMPVADEDVLLFAGEARAVATNWECIDADANTEAPEKVAANSFLYKYSGSEAGVVRGTIGDICHSTDTNVVQEAVCVTRSIYGREYAVARRENRDCEKLFGRGWTCEDSVCTWHHPPIFCGDGYCEGDENCSYCPNDCGICPTADET